MQAADHAFQDMRLQVGDRAQFAPPEQTGAGRVPVSIVGWVLGKSLIVSAPRTASGRLDLQAGEVVLLRAFTGRRAFAWQCTVQKRSAPPFEYLHLSFPDRVEALDVRDSPRYKVGLPATLEFGFVLHEVPVSLSLKCTIRSTKSGQDDADGPLHRHGVSFEALAPNDRLMLAALVWFHMYENPHLAA